MKYPPQLRPNGWANVEIGDSRQIKVPKATPSWKLWAGPAPGESFGNKPILDFKGAPAFAELAILWSFREAGWEGVWVDSYHRRYLHGFWPEPELYELPVERAELLARIGAGKPWDVFCWSSTEVMFAEAKRFGRDSIRESQEAFLASALNLGIPLESFLIVEWSVVTGE